ncbi:TraR/DksA C4-type zinc finger protein [Neptuniibacter sp. CAU 1671]|uniref:TraR/DksA family transcriptional regulator n=1 Tax=Neptuniibacter sp. CAU 1671 TaxID=3032593 RepID=UPI0023DB2617|nr:TraR/DksA C4-type zinc finger protein [Neptuniibacter sp. CAU 1671]MDF2180707.1 TraR/DksA C4-type zinc finger protein [Neptuniibacter sp. CAU 1671]
MSTFLTLKQLQNFKNELLELRQQLRLELQAEVVGRTVNETVANPISQDDSREFIASLHAELEACEAALYRLEQGCFGVCVACGEEVELSRLVASPVTSCCLRCQSLKKVV